MQMYISYPNWISPRVFSFLPIRWYAVMYIVAFAICYVLFRHQCKKGALSGMNSDDSVTLFTYVIFGLILGARIFSTLFYDGSWYYWTHPWMIFWPFSNGRFVGLPGMSYHGGAIGAVIGAVLYCRRYKRNLLEICDTVIAGIPLGYTFGRLGNFINGELWGRVTTSSIGMVFPYAESFSTDIPWVQEVAAKVGMTYTPGSYINLPRHPSQLYEALAEGIILFFILWFVVKPISEKNKTKHGPGLVTGFYFIGYGVFRFIIEYLREPDSQIGFVIALGKETEPLALFKSFLNISMGQILCFLMVVAGALVVIYAKKSAPLAVVKKKGKKNGHK